MVPHEIVNWFMYNLLSQDTTGVTIGFVNPPYSVIENEEQLVIQIGVIEGSLQTEVVVSFSTSDLTAISKLVVI